MLGSPLAVGSALTGGASDFLGGTNARRIGTLRWLLLTQAIGLAGAAVWVAIAGGGLPPASSLLEATAAGLALTTCLLALFRAMVIGMISIVAPVSATGVAIPIAAGIARGEHPGSLQLAGILAAVIGIVLASRIPRDRRSPGAEEGGELASLEAGLGLALIAALGGGLFFWLMALASRHGVAPAILVTRLVGAAGLALVLRLRRMPWRAGLDAATVRAGALAALLGVSSVALYSYATLHGALAVVSVLASLYPAVTVLLAYRVLGERVHGGQRLGILAVLAGVALLSA